MLQLMTATVVSALAGMGWLISRWLKRDAVSERIERRLKLVALHQRIKGAGLSEHDLKKIEQELSSKNGVDPDDSARKPLRRPIEPIVR